MIAPPLQGLIQVTENTWCQVFSRFYVLYKPELRSKSLPCKANRRRENQSRKSP